MHIREVCEEEGLTSSQVSVYLQATRDVMWSFENECMDNGDDKPMGLCIYEVAEENNISSSMLAKILNALKPEKEYKKPDTESPLTFHKFEGPAVGWIIDGKLIDYTFTVEAGLAILEQHPEMWETLKKMCKTFKRDFGEGYKKYLAKKGIK